MTSELHDAATYYVFILTTVATFIIVNLNLFIASHWFPYVKKRILVLDQEQFELSAIEVYVRIMPEMEITMH